MYIDFHTHAFTETIAEKAMTNLTRTMMESDFRDKALPVTNGTVNELVGKMNEWGVDMSVILPIATKPSQQHTINNWAKSVQEEFTGRLLCFGTVHPDAEDALPELERIKTLGLHGIKLHPDYQGFCADDEKAFPIYQKCAELGLPLIFHAGFDVVSPDKIHCTPQMGAKIADKFPALKMIMAHLGGCDCWDDTEKYLVGKNVYLDTAFTEGLLPDEQVLRIIRNHGSDKILFASDCPWHPSSREMKMLERLPLTEEERQNIFHRNAEKLLGLNGE